jgi:hypothetical protein
MPALKRVKCSVCGSKVIPWDNFPSNLHAITSCSFGVISYCSDEEYQEAIRSTPQFPVDYAEQNFSSEE